MSCRPYRDLHDKRKARRGGRGEQATMKVVQLDARTVDATSISVWAEDLWDGHGPAVYFLACAVLGNR